MVRAGTTARTPPQERLIQATQSNRTPKIIICVVIVLMIVLARWETSIALQVEEDDHRFFHNPMQRCIDSDDSREPPSECGCSDPMVPTKRSMAAWDTHHKQLAEDAYAAAQAPVDLVMIGDSIIERLRGTRNLARVTGIDDHLEVFDRHFTKSKGGALTGLALGASGDTANNLLWHLDNGWLPDRLKPKAWLILIGTNDMGRTGCSKRTTLAGILHVAQYLHDRRPGVPIIVHGLLPRADPHENDDDKEELVDDYSLGYMYEDILWINPELKRFCELHAEWIFMNAAGLFLERKEERLEINPTLMEDALHPSLEGYEVWTKAIVDFYQAHVEKNEGPSR